MILEKLEFHGGVDGWTEYVCAEIRPGRSLELSSRSRELLGYSGEWYGEPVWPEGEQDVDVVALPLTVGGKTVWGRDGDAAVGYRLVPHTDEAVAVFRPGQSQEARRWLEDYGWSRGSNFEAAMEKIATWLSRCASLYFPIGRCVVRDSNRGLARWARPLYFVQFGTAFFRVARWLEYGFLSILVAVCANPMRWFGATALFLQNKSERIAPKSGPNIAKLVTLFLFFPCFEMSNLCFEGAYLLNQLKLRLLSGKYLFLKLYDDPLPHGGIVHILQRLRSIKHRLESTDPGEYLRDHDPSLSPSFGDFGS